MSTTLFYPGLKVVVTKSQLPTLKVGENIITISLNVIKADVEYRLLGELVSSIFMYPCIRLEGDTSEILGLIERYREDAVYGALREAVTSLGDLYKSARLTPLYPMSRKAEVISGFLSRLYSRMNSDLEERNRVTEFYRRILDGVDGLEYEDGFYLIRSPDLILEHRSSVPPSVSSFHRSIMNRIAKLAVEKLSGPEIRVSGENLKILSTRFYLKCASPVEAASEYMECSEKPKCRSGHVISSSILCSCGESKIVVKDYGHMGGKWIVFKIMAKPMVEYRVIPRDRLIAEFQAMENLRSVEGIVTPVFHEVCTPSQYRAMAIREFIEGETLRNLTNGNEWRKAGRALGTIHSAGVTLGDANPGNFLSTPSGAIGVVDAEQSHSYTLKTGAWDIVTFLSTSLFWKTSENLILNFLEGYKDTAPQPSDVFRIASRAYSWIGILPTVPHIYVQSKKILEKIMKNQE